MTNYAKELAELNYKLGKVVDILDGLDERQGALEARQESLTSLIDYLLTQIREKEPLMDSPPDEE